MKETDDSDWPAWKYILVYLAMYVAIPFALLFFLQLGPVQQFGTWWDTRRNYTLDYILVSPVFGDFLIFLAVVGLGKLMEHITSQN